MGGTARSEGQLGNLGKKLNATCRWHDKIGPTFQFGTTICGALGISSDAREKTKNDKSNNGV
jgi:hypothetical protein